MQSTLGAGQSRPALARAPARVRRPGRPRRLRAVLVGANLVALVVAGTLWRLGASATPAAPPIPVPVSRGDIDVTIDSSGQTAAQRTGTLTFPAAGQVQSVLVKAGD